MADLEAVLAVRKFSSFRAAAEELCVTQPTVSSRVQHVEAVLGVILFHRTTRKVVPSDHGERFCEYAARALQDLTLLVSIYRDEAQLRAGNVIVGATPTVAATLAAEVIGKFRRNFPMINVTLIDDFYGRSLERLRTGEADFAVTPTLSIGSSLQLEEIGREEVLIVAPEGHVLVSKPFCNLETTLSQALVQVSSQTALSELISQAYASQGLLAPAATITHHSLSAVSLAKHTNSFTFLPSGMLRLLDMKGLGTASVAPEGLFRPICIATARDRAIQPAALKLMEFFRTHAHHDT